MRIILLSDLGGKIPTLPPETVEGVNFVLLAGDITLGAKHLSSIQRAFVSANSLFSLATRVFYIPGNHDYPAVAQAQSFVPENFVLMHDRSFRFTDPSYSRDILIIGFGGAKLGLYNNFAFSEDDIHAVLSRLFNDVADERARENLFTILLVHDPPFNTRLDITAKHEHVGSESMRRIIETFQPNLTVAGHIHESPGIDTIGRTTCVNAGEAKYGKYGVISIDDGDIHAELF
jgi:uncharacterized protein